MLLERLIGDRSRLPFDLLLALRSQLLHRRGTALLTILAISASVALAASSEMASRSVRSAVRKTADSLLGRAEIEVSAAEQGVPEEHVEIVRQIPGVASGSPVIQQTFRLMSSSQAGTALHVLGIDLLYEHEVRDYTVAQGGFEVKDPLRLVALADSLIISHGLARRLGVSEGDTLVLRAIGRDHHLTIRGLLSGGLADAFGGQIAVMDVYALQAMIGLSDRVSRIDVSVAEGREVGDLTALLQERLGPGVTVSRSTLREQLFHSILGAIEVGIWATVMIAIVLSLFSTYAVVSISVDRRIEELALLRAAGMEAPRVSRLIMIDSVIVSALGTVMGSVGAMKFSDPFIRVISQTSAYLQRVEIESLGATSTTLVIAASVGLPVALAATLEPAMRAGRRSPLDVLRAHRPSGVPRRPSSSSVSICLLFVALTIGAVFAGGAAASSLRLVVAVAFGIAAVGIGAVQLLRLSFPLLQRALGAAVPRVGYLAAGSLLARSVETGATTAIWSAVVAGVIATSSAIHSIALSVDEFFVGLLGPTATIAFAENPLVKNRTDRDRISPETVQIVRGTPGVLDVAEYLHMHVVFRGRRIDLSSLPVDIVQRRGGLATLSDDPEDAIEALQQGQVLMTKAFSETFGVDVGDLITLPTVSGAWNFRVAGLTRDYGVKTGTLRLEERVLRRWFSPRGSDALAIWTEEPSSVVLERISERVELQSLFFLIPEEYANVTQRSMRRFNALLTLPVALLGATSVVGLLNLLVGSVLARRRELAVIRASGGTSANLIAMVFVDAVLVGGAGSIFGLALGSLWGVVIADAIADALGWAVYYRLSAWYIAVATVASLAAALLAAVIPAVQGRRAVSLAGPTTA